MERKAHYSFHRKSEEIVLSMIESRQKDLLLIYSNGHGTLFHPREDLTRRAMIAPSTQKVLADFAQAPNVQVCVTSGSSVQDMESRIGLPGGGITFSGCSGAEMQRSNEHSPTLVKGANLYVKKAQKVQTIAQPMVEDMGLKLEKLPVGFKILLQGVKDVGERAKRRNKLEEKLSLVAWHNGIVLVPGLREVVARAPDEIFSKGHVLRTMVEESRPKILLVMGDSMKTDIRTFLMAHELSYKYPAMFVMVIGVIAPESPPTLYRQVDLVAHGPDDLTRFLEAVREVL